MELFPRTNSDPHDQKSDLMGRDACDKEAVPKVAEGKLTSLCFLSTLQ